MLSFAVPDLEPYALYTFRDDREVAVAMHRNGLHVDLRGPPPLPVQFTSNAGNDSNADFGKPTHTTPRSRSRNREP